MHPTPRSLLALFAALLLGAAGCSQHTPSTSSSPAAAAPPQAKHAAAAHPETSDGDGDHGPETTGSCPDPKKITASERDRANCYHLQPAQTTVQKRAVSKSRKTAGKTSSRTHASAATKSKTTQKNTPAKSAKTAKSKETKPAAKTAKHGKRNGKPNAKTAAAPEVREYRTVGVCQPQSLIYARCRTGVKTCQMGDTSPVQWFACARQNGATTAVPTAGSVLVLDANAGRNMPTGHPAYVEEATKNPDSTWTLRISHTNYDRKCHLDQDATVLFDPKRMTASFESGPWATWAKNLKAMGFILR
jgi:hypothetical protein